MIVLPRAIAFARRKVSEAWKRLKITGVGKTIAEAKIKSKQDTSEKISKDGIN